MINKLLPQEELNNQIWDENRELRQEVREKLLLTTKDFKAYLKIEELDLADEVQLIDLRFTGSLANFNWSEQSDIDLHLVFDFSTVNEEYREVTKQYFQARKALWNTNRDVQIFGYEVEVYPEDVTEEHTASGLYSIAKNEWINEPVYRDVDVNKELVAKKAKGLMLVIDELAKEQFSPQETLKAIEKIKEKIKKMRKEALSEKGEYSVGNLVFKVLRRSDYLGSLNELQTKIKDQILSLESEK